MAAPTTFPLPTPDGTVLTSLTCNLAQGPLLVDAPTQTWQQIGVTALGLDTTTYASAEEYEAATGEVTSSTE